uniref:Secreted C13 protease-like protein n=1 Tax=Pristhesancus plagipennis TaxID=1955184 RepID=A0A2K8JLQ5_PRIPG|nr:secreted C13 protease-like protein [Pristhesancus plagipennis]
MKVALCLLFGIVAIQGAWVNTAPEDWMEFKAKFGKVYKNSFEELFRMNVYRENKRKIEEHNQKFENGEVTYNLKMNHFGDLMQHEFKALMNRLKPSQKVSNNQVFQPTGDKVADSVDWRDKGAVTAIKDQGQCGSCWAFSTTGSLEGQLFIKNKKLVSVSEQQLVDCSGDYGNEGCNGGLMDSAFEYIKANGGIDTESSYPYEAEDDKCRFNKKNVAGTVVGFVDIKSGDEDALKEAVASIGPISVAIDAGNMSFQFYSSGVYNEPWCSDSSLDHGVLAVGYGTDNSHDYWLVKNSWGTVWGMDGYIKMTRNKNNQCGIATQASYPLV